MAEVSITLAEVSMIFGRTVMADLSFGRCVIWPMCHLADPSIGRCVIWPISVHSFNKCIGLKWQVLFQDLLFVNSKY